MNSRRGQGLHENMESKKAIGLLDLNDLQERTDNLLTTHELPSKL